MAEYLSQYNNSMPAANYHPPKYCIFVPWVMILLLSLAGRPFNSVLLLVPVHTLSHELLLCIISINFLDCI
jgi:hypothetical protein